MPPKEPPMNLEATPDMPAIPVRETTEETRPAPPGQRAIVRYQRHAVRAQRTVGSAAHADRAAPGGRPAAAQRPERAASDRPEDGLSRRGRRRRRVDGPDRAAADRGAERHHHPPAGPPPPLYHRRRAYHRAWPARHDDPGQPGDLHRRLPLAPGRVQCRRRRLRGLYSRSGRPGAARPRQRLARHDEHPRQHRRAAARLRRPPTGQRRRPADRRASKC